jgi:hypothetical protein
MLDGDWSSDVCSSDLAALATATASIRTEIDGFLRDVRAA